MSAKTSTKTEVKGKFETLLEEKGALASIPKTGDVIEGTVIEASRRAVYVDLNGVATGVIRGRELFNESQEYSHLKPGDKVEATVVELENEHGEIELSFRYASHRKAWDNLKELQTSQEPVMGKITDANKGGLMISVFGIPGFLPVSQLTPEHYPRVQGGDKNRILEKLKEFVGQEFKIKILDAKENEEKLIVSEKAAWEEKQQELVSKYKTGDVVEGIVTAVTNFGVFIKFDNLEGLVHISEIAWQRIDDPKDYVKVGEKMKAEIINVDGSKIFLSIKKLLNDPWKNVGEKYKVGDIVKGAVLKANPFGLFVKLDEEIHGLAHISELSNKTIADVGDIAKPGDILDFKIISLEPEHHRLGLSLKYREKTGKEKTVEEKKETDAKETAA